MKTSETSKKIVVSKPRLPKRSAPNASKLFTKRLNRNQKKSILRITATVAKQPSKTPSVQKMKRLKITEKCETGKRIRMFGVEELNNIEEEKGNKVKVLSSEVLVVIPDKPGSKMFKTYFGLLYSGTSSFLMDKRIVSIHGLDSHATPSKEKLMTQCGEFKTNSEVTLEKMKLLQFTIKRTVTAEINMFEKRRKRSLRLYFRTELPPRYQSRHQEQYTYLCLERNRNTNGSKRKFEQDQHWEFLEN